MAEAKKVRVEVMPGHIVYDGRGVSYGAGQRFSVTEADAKVLKPLVKVVK